MYQRPTTNNYHSMIRDDTHPPGWLKAGEAEFIRLHAENAKINCVLEIGTLFGRSTSYILEGLRAKYGSKQFDLWCIEPWGPKEWLTKTIGYPQVLFWDYMAEYDYCNNVHVIQCKSDVAAPIIRSMRYDFAFIDGDHHDQWVWHDLTLCSQVTNKILIHDYVKEDEDKWNVFWVVNQFLEQHPDWTIGRIVDRTTILTKNTEDLLTATDLAV